MLHGFVVAHREQIIARCRAKVAKRSIRRPPRPGSATVFDVPQSAGGRAPARNALEARHRPQRRDQRARSSRAGALGLAGRPRLWRRLPVHHGLAVEMDAPIDAEGFRTLNACLDDAIAVAVTQYATEDRQADVRAETARGNERMGFLAHELRNLINTAMLAFEVLKSGNVGVGGSTGSVLQRSLAGARDLIGRSLSEIQLASATQRPERLLVSAFVRNRTGGAPDGRSKRGHLSVEQADEADHSRRSPVLAAVVMNLLQNACKFTAHGTTVTLRVTAARARLHHSGRMRWDSRRRPQGSFRPFEQRAEDRSRLGLGLAFSRWGVEANHGVPGARTLPDNGCVFTIDLPGRSRPVASTF